MRLKSRDANSLESVSSYGLILVCPTCRQELELVSLKDGDQGYWCHPCERGWRAGHVPPESRVVRRKSPEARERVA